jgi:hypothetical protein
MAVKVFIELLPIYTCLGCVLCNPISELYIVGMFKFFVLLELSTHEIFNLKEGLH